MGSFRPPSNLSECDYLHRHVLKTRLGTTSTNGSLIQRVKQIVPFDNFCISGLDLDGCRVGAGIYLSADLPELLLREYRDSEYIKIDPLVRLVSPESPVGRWHDVSSADLADRDAQPVEAMLKKFGVAPRTVVSLWSGEQIYGAVLLTRSKPFSEEKLRILELFAEPLHSEAAAPVITLANERLNLTQGELRCLTSAADGKSSQEIASDTRYTAETVNFYLKSAMKKLGAANRTQAVVKAIRRKII
jgi:DNA-binding CsgD family transcriptional regulator